MALFPPKVVLGPTFTSGPRGRNVTLPAPVCRRLAAADRGRQSHEKHLGRDRTRAEARA